MIHFVFNFDNISDVLEVVEIHDSITFAESLPGTEIYQALESFDKRAKQIDCRVEVRHEVCAVASGRAKLVKCAYFANPILPNANASKYDRYFVPVFEFPTIPLLSRAMFPEPSKRLKDIEYVKQFRANHLKVTEAFWKRKF